MQKNIILHFNPSKCHFISYGPNNNTVFKAESKGIHLGYIIGSNISSDAIQATSYSIPHKVNAVFEF